MFQGFQFPKTILIWFEAHPGSAGWMQAIVAGIAIVAVYLAATIAAQTRRYQTEATSNGVPILGKAAAGMPIWQNNSATLRLCLMNLGEVIKQIQVQV